MLQQFLFFLHTGGESADSVNRPAALFLSIPPPCRLSRAIDFLRLFLGLVGDHGVVVL